MLPKTSFKGRMKLMKVNRLEFVVISLIGLLFTVTCTLSTVYALENDIGQSRIDPSSPFYFLKVVRENIEFKLAVTDRVKALRDLEFATRRLRESRALISKDQELIVPTLEKYKYHIKNLDYLLNEKKLKDEEVLIRTRQSLVVHLEILSRLYQTLSSARAKMAVRSLMNKIIGRTDIPSSAKLPICSFFAFEATTSAQLNDTERVILKERSKICFESVPISDKIR